MMNKQEKQELVKEVCAKIREKALKYTFGIMGIDVFMTAVDWVESEYTTDGNPMTNREWLESLSDEEFERKIYWLCIASSFSCNEWGKCYEYCGSCSRCRVAWLRAEHKEE